MYECSSLMECLFLPTVPFDAQTWCNLFCEYIEAGNRIIYSTVSAITFQHIEKSGIINIQDDIETKLKSIHALLKNEKEKIILLKLYDRINLCIQQANYISNCYSQALIDLNSKTNKINDTIQTTTKQVDDLEQKTKNAQREYVAVLAIFTAVILSFASGSMFLTSALNNVHQQPFLKVAFMSTAIGVILLNILLALFMFIKKVIGKEDKFPQYAFKVNSFPLITLVVIGICWAVSVVYADFFQQNDCYQALINTLKNCFSKK